MRTLKNLSDIKKTFYRRRYADVVRLLEPEVFRFRDHLLYYRLLGLSCLYLQDGGGAFSYLTRALQIKDDDVETLLGLAAVHLKKRNLDEALRIWLRVLELSPGNRTARRGLDRVRRGMSEDAVSRLVDSGKIRQFYPARPPAISPALVALVLAGAGATAGFFLLAPRLPAFVGGLFAAPPAPSAAPVREDVAAVDLSPHAMRTDAKAKARFTFTESEVDAVFKKAKDFFLAYRDNAGVFECNRLLASNASAYIKESARRLKSRALTPGFRDFVDFKDNYAFRAVNADPALYDGCFVLWRGTVANLRIGKEDIRFQFLVGSHDNRSFEGAVPVLFDYADKFENSYYIELLGRVVDQNGAARLQGVLFRRIIPDQPVEGN